MPAPKNRTKKTNRNNVVFPAAPPRRGNFYGRPDVYRRPSRNRAEETKTTVHAPEYSPVVAHRREIPCKRNVARAPAPAYLPVAAHRHARALRPWRIIEKTRPHEKTVALSGLPFRLFQILGKFVESHSEYFKHTYNVI